jgi:prevent-host-death family protein
MGINLVYKVSLLEWEGDMEQINIHQAKTHLSALIEQVANDGKAFIIAKAGKPMAKVIPFSSAKEKSKFRGSMKGQFTIPDDFDTMCEDEIYEMFCGKDKL